MGVVGGGVGSGCGRWLGAEDEDAVAAVDGDDDTSSAAL